MLTLFSLHMLHNLLLRICTVYIVGYVGVYASEHVCVCVCVCMCVCTCPAYPCVHFALGAASTVGRQCTQYSYRCVPTVDLRCSSTSHYEPCTNYLSVQLAHEACSRYISGRCSAHLFVFVCTLCHPCVCVHEHICRIVCVCICTYIHAWTCVCIS